MGTETRSLLGPYVAGLESYVPTVLRMVVGVTFLLHGLPKFGNMAGQVGFFKQLGIPLAEVMAPFIACLEVGGGVLLILGLATRLVSLLFMGEMFAAIVLVKSRIGFIAPPTRGAGAELDILLLAGAFALFVLGAGRWSAERDILRREV